MTFSLRTAPALLAFIASNHCVPPPVAPVIAGIAMHESGLSSTAIHDNVTGRSFNPETARDAVLLASTLITAGHDLDLGISQVNVRNFGWTGLTLQSAFDPCANLAAGVKVLFAKYNGSPPDTVKAAYAASVNGNLTKIDGAKDECPRLLRRPRMHRTSMTPCMTPCMCTSSLPERTNNEKETTSYARGSPLRPS